MNKRNGLDLDQVMDRMDPEDITRPAFGKRAGAWVGSVLIAALGAGTLAAAPSYAAAQAAQAAVAHWESLPLGFRARRLLPTTGHGVEMMAMTTTTEAPANPATGKMAAAETHRVVFSDPYAAEVTPVPASDAPRGAASTPAFSSAY